MLQVIAPHCPSCSAIAFHPLTLAVDGVLPPHPTDEQLATAENRWTCLGMQTINGKKTCQGRDDIVADPLLWEEWKREMRTRVTTTVLDGYYDKRSSGPSRGELVSPDGVFEVVLDRSLVPDPNENRRGKWTLTVRFDPDPLPHECLWRKGHGFQKDDNSPFMRRYQCVICLAKKDAEEPL